MTHLRHFGYLQVSASILINTISVSTISTISTVSSIPFVPAREGILRLKCLTRSEQLHWADSLAGAELGGYGGTT